MTLVIEHLTFAYGRMQALRDITVRAERGRVVAVLGPNAAGKSTLLRCVIGANKPATGCVLLDDQNVHRLRPHALASRIAYVPQRSTVSAAFSVRQVVELGRYALAPDPARVSEAISRLDLNDLQHRAYRTLSVGQQQRVTFARALAQLGGNETRGVLVLDEPTASMDLRHAAHALSLIRELAVKGCTIILAMHDLAMASLVADDAWLLCDGRLIAAGPARDVLETSRLQAVFDVGFRWTTDADGNSRLESDSPFAPQSRQIA